MDVKKSGQKILPGFLSRWLSRRTPAWIGTAPRCRAGGRRWFSPRSPAGEPAEWRRPSPRRRKSPRARLPGGPPGGRRRRASSVPDGQDFVVNSRVQGIGHKARPDALNLMRPAAPPDRTGEAQAPPPPRGTAGFFSFRKAPTPLMVPPVPTPATKISTRPSVSPKFPGRWSPYALRDWRD